MKYLKLAMVALTACIPGAWAVCNGIQGNVLALSSKHETASPVANGAPSELTFYNPSDCSPRATIPIKKGQNVCPLANGPSDSVLCSLILPNIVTTAVVDGQKYHCSHAPAGDMCPLHAQGPAVHIEYCCVAE